jgi:enamine deaminase RidA (YjgF/YER057c/UK114 family)
MSRIDDQLAALGIALPTPSVPAANYVPWVRTGDLVFIAGQIPVWNGERRFLGTVGAELDVAQAREAAKICGLNVLAHLRTACGGDLDRVVRCVRVGGFVACRPGFGDHPQVINACSDLFVAAFGEAGRHARTAVGVVSLPFGVAVEIDATFEVR